jgi:hypothetical protein
LVLLGDFLDINGDKKNLRSLLVGPQIDLFSRQKSINLRLTKSGAKIYFIANCIKSPSGTKPTYNKSAIKN